MSSSLWTPTWCRLDQLLSRLPFHHPVARANRIARVFYVLLLFPLHVFLVTVYVALARLESLNAPAATATAKSPSPLWLSSHLAAFLLVKPSWPISHKLAYPLVIRLVWAMASTLGEPPSIDWARERRISPTFKWLQGLYVTGPHVEISQEDFFLSEEELDEWIQGDARDPAGLVRPEPVPCFWLSPGHGELVKACEYKHERVVLYLVGGGFVHGSPASSTLAYDLCRSSGLKVLAVNYRKAFSAACAFPAALQDIVVAYAGLLQLGYRDIVLVGDSAGGGLCLTLTQYLCSLALSSSPPAGLVLPSLLAPLAPWVDLTLSTSLNHPEMAYDLLSPHMLLASSKAYLRNLGSLPTRSSSPYGQQGAAHSLLSPGLRSSRSALLAAFAAYQRGEFTPTGTAGLPKVLTIVGSADIFLDECRALFGNLGAVYSSLEGRKSPKYQKHRKLILLEFTGEPHNFFAAPGTFSVNASIAHRIVGKFLAES